MTTSNGVNQNLAKIFREIALYFEMRGIAFKPQAYEKAALSLETLRESIDEIYKKQGINGLKNIPRVGQGIAEKIIEYIKTGKIKEHQQLKIKTPVNIEELTAVEGVGPKMAGNLYKYFKIKNIQDLEKAAYAGQLRKLPRFGEKLEQKIIKSIEFHKKSNGRFLLGEILPLARIIKSRLERLKEVEKITLTGSLRRMRETIGDIDIMAASNQPKKVMDFFVSMPEVSRIYSKGKNKTLVRFKNGMDSDIEIAPGKSYGAAILAFTGDKRHNIALRALAGENGCKLNDFGLWRDKKMIAGGTEEEIYEKLGLQWIPPEIRENSGEIEAARDHQLPRLIDIDDIKGDLHCHSHWGAGKKLISEMAETAAKIGYEYIGISDHTKFLRIEHGLDEKQLVRQRKEIEKINSKILPAGRHGKIQNSKFRILQGCEANIMADGSIDIRDEALAKLDYAIAGVHSQMKMPEREMTERIIRAMRNPHIDIISHPTGRILKQRDEYKIDFDKILKIAKETGTVLEINANPYRLDLKDKNIRLAKKIGVKMIINSDAHQKEQMNFMEYGVSQARRGWCEKKDVINAWPLKKFLEFIKKPKSNRI